MLSYIGQPTKSSSPWWLCWSALSLALALQCYLTSISHDNHWPNWLHQFHCNDLQKHNCSPKMHCYATTLWWSLQPQLLMMMLDAPLHCLCKPTTLHQSIPFSGMTLMTLVKPTSEPFPNPLHGMTSTKSFPASLMMTMFDPCTPHQWRWWILRSSLLLLLNCLSQK